MRLYQILREQQVTELLQHALLTVGTEMGGYIIDCTADFHCVIADAVKLQFSVLNTLSGAVRKERINIRKILGAFHSWRCRQPYQIRIKDDSIVSVFHILTLPIDKLYGE